jgi:DMSO reductase anchor subunit
MHPAYSVIVFTTASGAGFGLLTWTALMRIAGPIPPGLDVVVFGLGLGLSVLGLLSSTLHLGRPERAWRALSQWRTSWLSREGIAAVFALAAGSLLALLMVGNFGREWHRVLAPVLAVSSIATVWCTGMIYESLTTIRAWNHRLTTEIYLVLAAASGLLLLHACLAAFQSSSNSMALAVAALLALAAALKLAYWRSIDAARRTLTAGRATGLESFGDVSVLDPPHTQANYVMREMGYAVARRHVAKLRMMAIALAFVAPALLVVLAIPLGAAAQAAIAILAVASCGAGLLTERWLFFAEAQHVVTLYYGAARA